MAEKTLDTVHSLAEIALRVDPTGKIFEIAETLQELNELVQDIPWYEANEKTSHLSAVRSALPTVRKRRIGSGVAASKSNVENIRDVVMLLEAWSEIDERLVRMSGNPAEYRWQEDKAFVEAFAQSVPGYVIYGANADEEMNGFATRYNATSAANVLSLGGTGSDLTSIYLVQWGRDAAHGIYPAGSAGGLSMEDKGIQTNDNNSVLYDVYRTKFQWDCGVVVNEHSSGTRGYPVWRLANVDTSSIATLAGTSLPDIDDAMIYALNHMPKRGMGAYIYGNADACTILDRLVYEQGNMNWYPVKDAGGAMIPTFRGHPIRICDQILSTETAVS